MMRRVLGGLGALLLAGCSEQLTAPGECPGLCPSDNLVVVDTVLTPVRDSTYVGFVGPGGGLRLLAADAFQGQTIIPAARFAPAIDSLVVLDTLRPAVLDSVILSVTVTSRDPAATGLALEFYRLPATIRADSTTTFADVQAALEPEALLGTAAIPDALTSGTVRVRLDGAELDQLAFAPADSSMLRLAYRLVGGPDAAVTLASRNAGGTGPSFISWLRVALPDTTVERGVPRVVLAETFVTDVPGADPGADVLAIGGVPSARAILRFDIPDALLDSAQIVRATLELVPTAPIVALAADSARLDVRGVFTDLGPKSPRIGTSEQLVRTVLLGAGSSEIVSLDVTTIARLWDPDTGVPAVLLLAASPEAASFARATFGSSRSPGFEPRLRLTYALPYPFEVQ